MTDRSHAPISNLELFADRVLYVGREPRAIPGNPVLDVRCSSALEALGKVLSEWYFAMFDVERKWGAVCLAEGKDASDLPNPDSLTRKT